MSRINILTLLTALVVVANAGCNKKPAPAAVVADESPSDARNFDRLLAGQEDDGNRAAEARAWLDPKNTQNVLWKTTRAQTMQFVDDLYDAGALKVLAVYASTKDGTIPVNLCADLLIVLPNDAAVRKKIFKAYNRIDKEIWGPDHEPTRDDGRKYLELNMDS